VSVESEPVDERSKRVERFFNWPVIIAAMLVIPVIIIEYTAVSDTVKSIATVCNWAIWLVFAAELVAMLWVVPNRWHWLVHNPLDVLIVVLTPPILPPGLQSLRVLRLLRLLRLVKLAQVSRRVFSFQGLRYAALLALLTIIAGGAAFAAADKGHDLNLWDGVFWAVGTMTTVGSNIQPDSTLGRIIAMVVMLVGIGFVALLTGAIAERFLGPEIKEQIGEVEVEAEQEATQHERHILATLHRIEERLDRLEQRG
jgi:voltage-gated potassium channel